MFKTIVKISLFILLLQCPYSFANTKMSADTVQEAFLSESLESYGTFAVDKVIDPQTILLTDGKIIRLENIYFPDYSAYQPGELSSITLKVLNDILPNKKIQIYTIPSRIRKSPENRMGHIQGQIYVAGDDVWIQQLLVSLGLAISYPDEYSSEYMTGLLTGEQQARQESLGLWSNENRYKIQKAKELNTLSQSDADKYGLTQQYHLVEGTITSSTLKKNIVYLNFGENWRSDFTVLLNSDIRKKLEKRGINPQNLQGRKMRIRGWIDWYNGVYIEPRSIHDITFLEPDQHQ